MIKTNYFFKKKNFFFVSDSSESCARMTATMGLSFVTERCVFKKSLDNEHIFVGISDPAHTTWTLPFLPEVPKARAPTLIFELHKKFPLQRGLCVCFVVSQNNPLTPNMRVAGCVSGRPGP